MSLADNAWPLILICAVLGTVLFFVWTGRGQRRYLFAAVGLFVLCGVAYVIERQIVTAAEQVEARVLALTDSFRREEPDAVEFISPSRPELRMMLLGAMALVDVEDDLRITDLQVTTSNNDSRAVAHFRANATISVRHFGNVGFQPARFELTWQREGDDWHVVKVRRLNPINGEEMHLLEQSPE